MTLTLPPSPLTDERVADGRQASATRSRVIQRRCLNCGELGHYRKSCPRHTPAALLEAARAEIARLEAVVERLTIETDEKVREAQRIERSAQRVPMRLAKVRAIELTCVNCGQTCERAVVHKQRERDQGHAPAVYGEQLTYVRAVAIAS